MTSFLPLGERSLGIDSEATGSLQTTDVRASEDLLGPDPNASGHTSHPSARTVVPAAELVRSIGLGECPPTDQDHPRGSESCRDRTRPRPMISNERPVASSAAALRRMQTMRRRDTKPELVLRSALHRSGRRFLVDRAPLPGLRRRADLVFRGARVAVFVDGCFWHGCPIHRTWPKANADWWRTKIEQNRQRDADTDRQLDDAGWKAIRIWEHEPVEEALQRVLHALDPTPR